MVGAIVITIKQNDLDSPVECEPVNSIFLINKLFINLFTTFIVIITGILLRYLIFNYLGVNVFIDYSSFTSVCYYFFMAF